MFSEILFIKLQTLYKRFRSRFFNKEFLKDEAWLNECKIQDKHTFMNRAERNVKGIILENAIIANAFINYKSERDLYIKGSHHHKWFRA